MFNIPGRTHRSKLTDYAQVQRGYVHPFGVQESLQLFQQLYELPQPNSDIT